MKINGEIINKETSLDGEIINNREKLINVLKILKTVWNGIKQIFIVLYKIVSYIGNVIRLGLRFFVRMNWVFKLVIIFFIVNLIDEIQYLDLQHHTLEKILMLLKR
ncbi:MAG: hypothetical protein ACPLXO_03305, partial [Desulfurella sp.]